MPRPGAREEPQVEVAFGKRGDGDLRSGERRSLPERRGRQSLPERRPRRLVLELLPSKLSTSTWRLGKPTSSTLREEAARRVDCSMPRTLPKTFL
eukprot:6214166-Pleurochrysis_carterae.AAC.2